MKISREKAVQDAKFLVDRLPEQPLAWGIVGSATHSIYPHDVDICLVYDHQAEWMKDKKVWLQGWNIPFDLFFMAHTHEGIIQSAINGIEWRGDGQEFNPPSLTLKVLKELIY